MAKNIRAVVLLGFDEANAIETKVTNSPTVAAEVAAVSTAGVTIATAGAAVTVSSTLQVAVTAAAAIAT